MARTPVAWDRRTVPSRVSNVEPVKALPDTHVGQPSLELADYRTEYGLLGPLEVIHRGVAVTTGGQRKRALLARLLLEANRTVSIDALVDALWGERVPSTAVKMVHIYVSQLRKVLPSGALQTRPPGYRLEVAPEAVDLLRFERLSKEGREALADDDVGTAFAEVDGGWESRHAQTGDEHAQSRQRGARSAQRGRDLLRRGFISQCGPPNRRRTGRFRR